MSNKNDVTYLDVFDPAILEKVGKAFDIYCDEGEFNNSSIIDAIQKDITGNEHLNTQKIMRNLGLAQKTMEEADEILLDYCMRVHAVKNYIAHPEKFTLNHKLVVYAYDLFTEMFGDPEYPHQHYQDQLSEITSLSKKLDNFCDFVPAAFEVVMKKYVKIYTEFAKEHKLD